MSTNHNWRGGDVALKVSTSPTGRRTAVRTICVDQCPVNHVEGLHWHHATGGWDHLEIRSYEHETTEYLPLVVLNPADDKEMVDLARAYVTAADNLGHPYTNTVHDRIVARLREALSPTPPPCGWGATINGASGSCSVLGQHDTHLINNVSISVGTA